MRSLVRHRAASILGALCPECSLLGNRLKSSARSSTSLLDESVRSLVRGWNRAGMLPTSIANPKQARKRAYISSRKPSCKIGARCSTQRAAAMAPRRLHIRRRGLTWIRRCTAVTRMPSPTDHRLRLGGRASNPQLTKRSWSGPLSLNPRASLTSCTHQALLFTMGREAVGDFVDRLHCHRIMEQIRGGMLPGHA